MLRRMCGIRAQLYASYFIYIWFDVGVYHGNIRKNEEKRGRKAQEICIK